MKIQTKEISNVIATKLMRNSNLSMLFNHLDAVSWNAGNNQHNQAHNENAPIFRAKNNENAEENAKY